MRLRRMKYSYRQIADRLGLDHSTVYESHMAGLRIIGIEVPKSVVEKSEVNEYRRLEESEHAEAVMRELWDTYRECRDTGSLRNAIEALNSLRGWTETTHKMHGMQAPTQVQHTITVHQIEQEIAALEAEQAPDGTYEIS